MFELLRKKYFITILNNETIECNIQSKQNKHTVSDKRTKLTGFLVILSYSKKFFKEYSKSKYLSINHIKIV